MAVPTIQEQLARIEAEIKARLGEKGLQKVADEVVKEGKKQVEQVVYNAYQPKFYDRTMGLRDQWGTMWVEPLIIGVYSDRWDGDKYLAPIIISGEGYSISGGTNPYPYEQPRPFIEETIKELERNKNHVKAFKSSLEDVGFKVKIKRNNK